MGLKLAPKYVHRSFIKLHEIHWRFNNPSVEALERERKSSEMLSFQVLKAVVFTVKLNTNKNIGAVTKLLTLMFLKIMSYNTDAKSISITNVKTHTFLFFVVKLHYYTCMYIICMHDYMLIKKLTSRGLNIICSYLQFLYIYFLVKSWKELPTETNIESSSINISWKN